MKMKFDNDEIHRRFNHFYGLSALLTYEAALNRTDIEDIFRDVIAMVGVKFV